MEHTWYSAYPKGIKRTINPDEFQNLAQMMEHACVRFKDEEGLVCIDESMTYGELNLHAENFASYLQNRVGLKKGDRFAIMLPNLSQFAIAFFAAQKIGVICVNTNPLYTPREMRHQFKDSGCKAILILDVFLEKLSQIVAETDIQTVIATGIGDFLPKWKGLLIHTVIRLKGMLPHTSLKVTRFKHALDAGRAWKRRAVEVSSNDICVLQYTGGTTGVSKGAMLSHRNVIANVLQLREWAKEYIASGSKETVLTVLPLYHIFALTVNFIACMSEGQKIILVPRPIPIKNTVKIFKKYDISIVTGVNTLFNALLNDPKYRKLKPRTIKCAMAGAMALQEGIARDWEKLIGSPIIEGYGLTEASPVTHSNPLNEHYRIGSIGVPVPSTEAKVVDADGKEVKNGQVGELIIRGPQVMQGYWQKPEETAKVLRNGWLWTGDLATTNDDGFFSIVDRKKDMIIVSGFNVYPNEVEEVIASHPKVLEAAIVGIPDKKAGEMIRAFYVPKDPSLTQVELIAHCRANLAAYKIPKEWVVMSNLPKSSVGKILRRELRGEPGAAPATVQFNSNSVA